MTATADKVLQDAMGLSEQERAEIERRCAALDAGKTGTTDWEDVRRQIKTDVKRRGNSPKCNFA